IAANRENPFSLTMCSGLYFVISRSISSSIRLSRNPCGFDVSDLMHVHSSSIGSLSSDTASTANPGPFSDKSFAKVTSVNVILEHLEFRTLRLCRLGFREVGAVVLLTYLHFRRFLFP